MTIDGLNFVIFVRISLSVINFGYFSFFLQRCYFSQEIRIFVIDIKKFLTVFYGILDFYFETQNVVCFYIVLTCLALEYNMYCHIVNKSSLWSQTGICAKIFLTTIKKHQNYKKYCTTDTRKLRFVCSQNVTFFYLVFSVSFHFEIQWGFFIKRMN